MKGPVATSHGLMRLDHRGLSMADAIVAWLVGREVEGGLLVLRKDAERVAAELEHMARRMRRLSGLRTVEVEGCLVTAYRARRKKQKRLLRQAAQRDLECTR